MAVHQASWARHQDKADTLGHHHCWCVLGQDSVNHSSGDLSIISVDDITFKKKNHSVNGIFSTTKLPNYQDPDSKGGGQKKNQT